MIEHLKLNPAYALWEPNNECVSKSAGVEVPQEFPSWPAFGPCALDDYTECAHFYFELERPKKECSACAQSGYNPETKVLADTFYDFEGTDRRWHDKITQDEVDTHLRVHSPARPSKCRALAAPSTRGGLTRRPDTGSEQGGRWSRKAVAGPGRGAQCKAVREGGAF